MHRKTGSGGGNFHFLDMFFNEPLGFLSTVDLLPLARPAFHGALYVSLDVRRSGS